LRQHAENPVDWFAWGEEAFAEAARRDVPVFVSIGYSTCHWCHVMAHESFEHAEAARLLNEAFVCVKVDREERPDIDELYMNACQMMTGQGGWPLTIVMTPDRQPFFAATYIPLEDRMGRYGLLNLVPALAEAWKTRRQELLQAGAGMLQALRAPHVAGDLPDQALVERAFEDMALDFDAECGGFGHAPKFPMGHKLLFLMNHDADRARDMVLPTLCAMAAGGVWDQVGGGVHRYSTDRYWRVPHFEKMLYDQATTALACCTAYVRYGDEVAACMAQGIYDYVLRDLLAPDGGFYAAEDADSEGQEGTFYAWRAEELRQLLTDDEYAWLEKAFHVSEEGNRHDEATGKACGDNILFADTAGVDRGFFEPIRRKLFAARSRRVRPMRDEKILTDWNGLMIAALARGARVFGHDAYAQAAKVALAFVERELCDEQGRLLHCWCGGKASVRGQLDDYAFLIFGLLELYETGFDEAVLERALRLNDAALELFLDANRGGFFRTAAGDATLPVRTKPLYDGAIPSGNGMLAKNLLRLARLTGRVAYEREAERTVRAYAAEIRRFPMGFAQALDALNGLQRPGEEVVIVATEDEVATQKLLDAARKGQHACRDMLLKRDGSCALDVIAPFTSGMRALDGKPTAYVCRGQSCSQPVTQAEELDAMLINEF
jgi:hypothetical protein